MKKDNMNYLTKGISMHNDEIKVIITDRVNKMTEELQLLCKAFQIRLPDLSPHERLGNLAFTAPVKLIGRLKGALIAGLIPSISSLSFLIEGHLDAIEAKHGSWESVDYKTRVKWGRRRSTEESRKGTTELDVEKIITTFSNQIRKLKREYNIKDTQKGN